MFLSPRGVVPPVGALGKFCSLRLMGNGSDQRRVGAEQICHQLMAVCRSGSEEADAFKGVLFHRKEESRAFRERVDEENIWQDNQLDLFYSAVSRFELLTNRC